MMDKARILIVEDEIIIALDLRTRLTGLGYDVPPPLATGEEAVCKVDQLRPQLVLMDVVLKGHMDGVQAAEQIHAGFDIPVIYLTAYSDEQTLQRAKVTEPYGYVLKPFEDRELYTAIEVALHKHQMEQQLRESERWLSTTLRSVGDALIATDAAGRVRLMNPVAEALTGWEQAAAQGRDVMEILHLINAETRAPAINPISRVLAEKTTINLTDNAILIARDGRETAVDDSAAPIKDEHDQITGVVLVFRDVTARKQAENMLRQRNLELGALNAELQARNAELDAFAHTVAHDLKNPLGLIVGHAELLSDEDDLVDDAERARCLAQILQNGHKMDNIIEELLLLAEVRKAEVVHQRLDMDLIVAEARCRLNHLTQVQHAVFVLPTTWPCALGYAPWIEEVWVNYLSNAIKYGGRTDVEPPVPPRIELGAEAQPDGSVRCWVRDNGNGLTPAEQARLFVPFTRLEQARARGHGLGLSIVRRIVEKLGGSVSVASQPGEGSTFAFTLPGCQ
jgi:PAS domain S-box-containing protein